MRPLIIDNFAGGGGASTGLEAAFGRPVDVAVNHDEAAIAVHAANHPHTKHLCQSIMAIDPLEATGGRPTLLVWFSPDCKHHSKAKGGKPREKNIRDLAWVVPHWIERLKKATPNGEGAPVVIMLENVEEFRDWGPLDAEGRPIKARKGEEFKLWVARIRRLGYKVEWKELYGCDYGAKTDALPDDQGGFTLPPAPTKRKRLFLIARRDGRPIVWPKPTHGKAGSEEVASGARQPWRTAAECINWTLPCPSIFDRKKPLEDATCRRIAAGVMRYVVNSARPFIVPVTNVGWNPDRTWPADEPLRTITTARGGEYAVAVPHVASLANRDKPFTAADEPMQTVVATGCKKVLVGSSMLKLRKHSDGEDPAAPLGAVTAGGQHHGIAAASMVQMGYGEREGQAPRALDIEQPLGTVVAGGTKHAAVAAFLHKYRPKSPGADVAEPMPTVTANSFTKRAGGAPPLAVTSAHLEQANTGVIGHDVRSPMSTIVGSGSHQRLVETTMIEADALPPEMMERAVRVAAFLVKYYATNGENETAQVQAADQPLDTVTTKARFAVVTVTIDAVTFVLVDIGMRMLVPRELANAQNFPRNYILDPVCWYVTDKGNRKYGRLPIAHQISKIGNSVNPNMAEVLARLNLPEHCTGYIPQEQAA